MRGAQSEVRELSEFCSLKDLVMALAVDVPGVAEYVRGRLARYKVKPRTHARTHTHAGAGTEQTHHAQAREAREQGRRTLAGENHPPPRPPTHMCTRPRLQADEMFKAADAAEEDEDEEDEDVEAMNAMLLGATPPRKRRARLRRFRRTRASWSSLPRKPFRGLSTRKSRRPRGLPFPAAPEAVAGYVCARALLPQAAHAL